MDTDQPAAPAPAIISLAEARRIIAETIAGSPLHDRLEAKDQLSAEWQWLRLEFSDERDGAGAVAAIIVSIDRINRAERESPNGDLLARYSCTVGCSWPASYGEYSVDASSVRVARWRVDFLTSVLALAGAIEHRMQRLVLEDVWMTAAQRIAR